LQALNKKLIIIVFLVLILFAGIIALTQESDDELPDMDFEDEYALDFEFDPQRDEWNRPARWFRSNSGGMALEEVKSRFAALRNQYALAINYVSDEELPEYLLTYYDENYYVEVRILYKRGEQIRTQWIFRDEKNNTRLNAVFLEPELTSEREDESVFNDGLAGLISVQEDEEEIFAQEPDKENEILTQPADEKTEVLVQGTGEEPESLAQETGEAQEEDEKIEIIKDIKNRKGFIEIFNEDLFLTLEYRFFENGKIEKTEYKLKENLLISAIYFMSDNGVEYKTSYIDYYRYNRSLSLRNIERIFQKDGILEEPVVVTFPRRIMDTIRTGISISERLNLYPEFFGDIFVYIGSKMIFDIDDRGRILGQILYDDEDNVIWTIRNTWQNNRIEKTTKTEGKTVLIAEYVYSSNGDRILERNIKNGSLERVVTTDGDTEIEELYINNVVVIRAVWENGRKISESMVRN
jgi:hypothetical protein